MTGFIALTVASLVFAFATSARPRLALGVILVVALVVPMAAVVPWATVGGLTFHPASLLTMSVFLVQATGKTEDFASDLTKSWALTLLVGAFLAAAQWVVLGASHGQGEGLVINQIITPLLIAWLLRRLVVEHPGSAETLARVVVGVAVFEALVALGVDYGFWPQPFATLLLHAVPPTDALGGLQPTSASRAYGTTDFPLILSGILVMGVSLLPSIRSVRVQLALLAPLSMGLLATQSRTGLVVAGGIYVMRLMAPGYSARTRLAVLGGLGVAAVSAFSFAGGAAALERFANDDQSAAARWHGYGLGVRQLGTTLVEGGGIGFSYRMSFVAGRGTTFENPLLMYSFDFGTLFTVGYFLAMAVITVRSVRRGGLTGPGLVAVAGLATALSFNSIASNTTSGFQLWISLGLAAALTRSAGSARQSALESPVRRTAGRLAPAQRW